MIYLDNKAYTLLCLVMYDSLQPHGLQPARLYPWGFSRQAYWSGLPCPIAVSSKVLTAKVKSLPFSLIKKKKKAVNSPE